MNSWVHVARGTALAAAICLFSGCSRSEPVPRALKENSPATNSVQSQLSEADRAWLEILKDADPPDLPKGWEDRAVQPDEAAKFLAGMADKSAEAADRARAFHSKYPEHARATEARLREHRQLAVAVHFEKKELTSRLADLRRALDGEKKLQEAESFFMRSSVADRLNYLTQLKPGLVRADDFETQVRELQKDFPRLDQMFDLLLDLAKTRLGNDEVERAAAIAREVNDNLAASEPFKESAASILKRVAMLGKPLSLRYTASDGTAVDMEALRGKVVLVDGWATTCAICMEELPHLKGLYSKLRPRGFEIVGINFDDEKEAAGKLILREKLAWPNYVDGKGWDGKFGQEFQITSLPVLWLVDKKGVLRDVNALRDLDRKVEALLQE